MSTHRRFFTLGISDQNGKINVLEHVFRLLHVDDPENGFETVCRSETRLEDKYMTQSV